MKKLCCNLLMFLLFTSLLTACGTAKSVPEEPTAEKSGEENKTEDALTEKEAVETAREEVVEEPVFSLYENTISDELKKKADAFPKIDDALPGWRGVNLVNKAEFSWAWVYTVPTDEDTPYETVLGTLDETAFDETTVLEVKEAGYNFVRVCLDDRYFFTDKVSLEYTGQDFYGNIDTVNEEQYKELDNMIGWCIENGIHVCLDLHSTPGGLMIGGDEETTREPLFTEGSREQEIFVRFWEIMANRYADISTNALSFNLYNEPPHFLEERKQEMLYIDLLNRAVSAIQEVTPERLIVVDTMSYSTVGLEHVDELQANNLLISFHIYSEEATDLDIDSMNVDRNCNEVRTRLADYNKWAEKNNVRWMLQEYGCSTFINQEDQKAYLSFVTEQCREYGVSYCYYAFNAGSFGVCMYAEGDEMITPGAEYGMTCGGHRINTELANITAQ